MATAVQLAVARPISFRHSSTAIGTVLAPRSITLSNEVPGTVAEVALVAGAVVEQGAVLLRLDSSIEAAQLESARAAAKIAASRFERIQQAFNARALTALELEEAEAQLAQANARVAELQAVIAQKTLVAPFRARVGLSDTHEGQYLPAGTQITSLQSVDDYLLVDFMLPQSVVDSINVGQSVTLAYENQPLQATIEALDSRTDRLTRSRLVRARLDSPPGQLIKPGDSVRVLVEYGPEIPAVAIPLEAIRRTPTGAQIFVAQIDEQGGLRARQRIIEIGQNIGDEAAVLTGVQANERVVTTGSFKLLDGGLLQAEAADQQAPRLIRFQDETR